MHKAIERNEKTNTTQLHITLSHFSHPTRLNRIGTCWKNDSIIITGPLRKKTLVVGRCQFVMWSEAGGKPSLRNRTNMIRWEKRRREKPIMAFCLHVPVQQSNSSHCPTKRNAGFEPDSALSHYTIIISSNLAFVRLTSLRARSKFAWEKTAEN